MAKTNGNSEVTETEQAPAKPAISKESRRKLFDSYAKLDAAVSVSEKALVMAQTNRTKLVLEIIEKCGNGPFSFDGEILTATKRNKKDGSTVAYFRGPGKAGVDEI
jgi:F0F1-type ATP synthase delta subunit